MYLPAWRCRRIISWKKKGPLKRNMLHPVISKMYLQHANLLFRLQFSLS